MIVRRDVALGLRSSAPCRIVGAFRPETGRRTGVVLYCTNSEGSVNLPVKKPLGLVGRTLSLRGPTGREE